MNTTGRPRGSNADEWRFFLSVYLDDRATNPDGLSFVAVQIVEAIEAERERCAGLQQCVNPASNEERFNGVAGVGAMAAVIEYRDLIRNAPHPCNDPGPEVGKG